ncbi:MAG: ATP-binding cassette domain-containing protein [Planctomycetota bacterium]|jgi:ABC-type transporter Mla maintaining outer membrane lipid asymmetry ATPase subunit MlaF
MPDPILTCRLISKKAPIPELGELSDVNFTLRRGESAAILGMNRWERRAFIDVVSAVEPPDSGEILFLGKDLTRGGEETLNSIRGRMGILTHPPVFLNNIPIMENLRLPLRYHSRMSFKDINARLAELLVRLNLTGFSDVIPSNFEPHFLGAAGLVRALSVSPDLLLVERPGESLGKEVAFMLPDLWKLYVTNRGGSALVLTTIPRLALALCEKIAVFENGSIQSVESNEEFKNSKRAKETLWKAPEKEE